MAALGAGWHGRPMMRWAMVRALADPSGIGLKPERHIAGFSIRKEDGTALPLIFEACIGKARDTVVLKLSGAVPGSVALVRLRYGPVLQPGRRLGHGGPRFRPDRLDELFSLPTLRRPRTRPRHRPRRSRC